MAQVQFEERNAVLRFSSMLTAAAIVGGANGDFSQACQACGLNADKIKAIMPNILELGARTPMTKPAVSQSGQHMAWKMDLYTEVMGEPPTGSGQLQRLDECLMSIPSKDAYVALVKKCSGEWPSAPRPGRADDEGIGYDSETPLSVNACAAIEHLRDERRKQYILTGDDDLEEYFDGDVIEFLKAIQVHIAADLERFSEQDIIALPGITMKAIAQIYWCESAMMTVL